MATPLFFSRLTSIVEDLSQEMPAAQRYRRLLEAMLALFPCDAAALLRREGDHLRPLAVEGLAHETLGRRFRISDHPRLQRLIGEREPVRFAADSPLPDPYDGLVQGAGHLPRVHDCMGCSLSIDGDNWGLLTLDALEPGTFDAIDPLELKTFIGLTQATVKAAARIEALAQRAEQEHRVARTLAQQGPSSEIIGESAIIRRLRQEVSVVAGSPLNVLVLGETGVGKERVARQIHQQSARCEQPLVHINCAALPENLAESELFGHERGAFSGALKERAGKFEVADGGTLFLDEVGELPLGLQAMLLRVLQDGDIQRVGSDQPIQVDVRIVAATNRDLEQEVKRGRFRADLFHRLSVYPVQVPPLRERGRDILLLAGYLLEANQRRLGVPALRLSDTAQSALLSYHWPGNVRELEHLLSRAALKALGETQRKGHPLAEQGVLQLDIRHLDLPALATQSVDPARPQETEPLPDSQPLDLPLSEATRRFQIARVEAALARHDGNQAAAARSLGLHRSNFSRLLKRLGIRGSDLAL